MCVYDKCIAIKILLAYLHKNKHVGVARKVYLRNVTSNKGMHTRL